MGREHVSSPVRQLVRASVEGEWNNEGRSGKILKAKHRYPQKLLCRPLLTFVGMLGSFNRTKDKGDQFKYEDEG